MKKLIILLITIFSLNHALAQEKDLTKIADSIYNGGMRLYKSEWASWYGTDIFRDKCKNLLPSSGGYLSYDSGAGLVNIFFSKDSIIKVLSTITFAYGFDVKNYKLDTTRRDFNTNENNLYVIRQTALKKMNQDTFFKHYKNTNLNLVPIIVNGTKKVYVLTGPDVNGVVVFGNDYEIDFDQENQIVSRKRLHKNIIPIYTNKDTTDVTTFHVHLPETGDFITETDVCTLLLYEKMTKWTQHDVGSKNYFSIWDCKKDKLFIMTMAAIRRIEEDQKKRKEDKSKN